MTTTVKFYKEVLKSVTLVEFVDGFDFTLERLN